MMIGFQILLSVYFFINPFNTSPRIQNSSLIPTKSILIVNNNVLNIDMCLTLLKFVPALLNITLPIAIRIKGIPNSNPFQNPSLLKPAFAFIPNFTIRI